MSFTIDDAHRGLQELGIEESQPEYVPGMVLLGSLFYGPNGDRLSRWMKGCGVKGCRMRVREISRRYRENGIWDKRRIDSEPYLDEETGIMAFILDVLVGSGQAERGEGDGPLYSKTGQSMTEVAVEALQEVMV